MLSFLGALVTWLWVPDIARQRVKSVQTLGLQVKAARGPGYLSHTGIALEGERLGGCGVKSI
jgi:hypothetical protein